MAEKISLVARQIANGGKNIIFTGAGISTESGIPDFRSKGGIWDKYRPVYFDEFMSSREARIEYWERKIAFYPDLINAKPNPAHMSVAELHGNTRRARCMSCLKIVSIHDVHKRIEEGDPAPECECGGYLKSDTISFGQAMPVDEVEKATRLS